MDGIVPPAGLAHGDQGALSGGGQHPSGRGCADGGIVGTPGSAAPAFGPGFDTAVPTGGYLWWYLDGLSDDEGHATTLIAFIGSVFSPYYAWTGRRDPLNHCAVNVALYGKGARWAMTERGAKTVTRSAQHLSIGPSALRWQDDALEITLDEIGAPLPKPIRGTIRVVPHGLTGRRFALDAQERHLWQPIAPKADIEVNLSRPNLRWRGTAYLDSNFGSEPLEAGFADWTWSRAHLRYGSVVHYEAARRDGSHAALALRFDSRNAVETAALPPRAELPRGFWGIARSGRADDGAVRLHKTLEDAPFYARSWLKARLDGEPADIFHESLSLTRFRSPIVRAMLPFRMPRRFW